MKLFICVILFNVLLCSVLAEETNSKDKSPYIELILCPSMDDPWECARQQTSRLLDEWSSDLKIQWQDLKGAADKELNSTLVSRGFTSIEHIKEKPSTMFTKLEIGTNYLSKFAQESADEFLGRDDNLPIETDPAIITNNANDDDDDDNNDNKEKFGIVSGGHGGGHVGLNNNNGGLNNNVGSLLKKKPFGSNNFQTIIHQDPFNINGFDHILDANNKIKKHGLNKPFNHGRSNGVQRGKKKKKKALMKLMFLATVLKGKIELLLKILSAHLQVKFFAIALIGLIINIARFWVDLKRGGIPQKVIYYEHAHHQHHYDEQGSEDWGEQGASVPASGGYWKRSLPNDNVANNNNNGVASSSSSNTGTSSQINNPVSNVDLTYSSTQNDPHYMAYRNYAPSTYY